jgi:hypothetical protein
MKTFTINMTHTKDREIFMDEVTLIMNAFDTNKKYLVDVYSQVEEKMTKDDILPFEAASVALIDDRGEHNMKYSKALFNYIYWEYDYIIHENKNNPFMFDCLKNAINYVERNGLQAFKKKYGKNKTH